VAAQHGMTFDAVGGVLCCGPEVGKSCLQHAAEAPTGMAGALHLVVHTLPPADVGPRPLPVFSAGPLL